VKQQHPQYTRVEIAGDFRRGCELVTNLGLVAETKLSSDAEKPSGQLTLTVTDKKHFGASLLHATGSAEHLEQLAQLARKKGFQLKPEGLYGGKRLMASATENDIYKALDLQFIEPYEKDATITRATKHTLPKHVSDQDLHGILHCHTTASDGTETLDAMAEATRERGLEYFGVADHSISAHYAAGLSLDEIARQHRKADRLNKSYGKSFRILKGIEADMVVMARLTTRTVCSARSILWSQAFTAASRCRRSSRPTASSKQSRTPRRLL
jgi:DNA polymerase (family 10)